MSNDGALADIPPIDDLNGDDNETSMYASAISPGTVNVSLDDDDDDEDPFGERTSTSTRQKTLTNTTNTVETTADDENKLFKADTSAVKVDEDDDDLFQKKNTSSSLTIPTQVPIAKPATQASQLYPTDLNTSSSPSATYDSGFSKDDSNETSTISKPPIHKRSNEHTIEITVSDPAKVGDVSFFLQKKKKSNFYCLNL